MQLQITDSYYVFKKDIIRPSSSNRIWLTREGHKIPISKMTDSHLTNSINYLKNRYDKGKIRKRVFNNSVLPLVREFEYRKRVQEFEDK